MGRIMNVFCEGDDATLYNVREVNSSFAVASLDIMYTGKNPNMSNISRASVEDALPTLYNVPIVCNYDPELREIGGHDVEFMSDDDGNVSMRNLTVPCGVITDHTKFSFQNKKDKNGVEHEYLVADGVVLWKRQDVYEYITEDLGGVVPHSMEIDVLEGRKNKKTKYYDIDKFEFTALCLLGNVRPCFEGSQLQVYSATKLKDEISEMFDELKQCYSLIATAADAVDNNTTHSSKGGDRMHDEEIMKLAEEFGIDVSTLDFSLEGMSVDDVRAKFEEITAATSDEGVAGDEQADNADDTASEPESVVEETPTEDSAENFELNRNLYDNLYEALSAEKVHYDWGDMTKYWMVDFDADKTMIYAEDSADWKIYGFKYTMDGDNVVIDWESKSRMKWAIVEFDEGSKDVQNAASNVFSAMTSMVEEAMNKSTALQTELDGVNASFSELSAEVEDLRAYKASSEETMRANMVEAVFAMFDDLDGNETFEAFKQSVIDGTEQYDKDALEEKCYALRGRLAVPAKFSATQKTPKIQLDDESNDNVVDKPYGGIVEKYSGVNI